MNPPASVPSVSSSSASSTTFAAPDSLDPLENFPVLHELPSKSLKQLTSSSSLTGHSHSNTKRGNILIENLKFTSKKTKSIPISSNMLHRTQSLPGNSVSSCPSDEITQISEAASESDVLDTKTSSTLTGFQRFRQIVQSANQSTKRKSLAPEVLSETNQPLLSDDSLSGMNSSQRDTPLTRIDSQQYASSTPSQAAISLPGGIFHAVVQGASTNSFSLPQPSLKMNDLKNQPPLRSQDLFGSSRRHSDAPSENHDLQSEEIKSTFPQTIDIDLIPATPVPSSRVKSRDNPLSAIRPEDISNTPLCVTSESRITLMNRSPIILPVETNEPREDRQTSSSAQSNLPTDISGISDSEDYTLSSICFSLEERITSCTTTLCGSYIISGFSTGHIRLYELLKSGNTDLEDRFGYILGHISSIGNTGLRIHVQCAGGLIPTPWTGSNDITPPRSHLCSHVFVGARLGSTKFYVIDALSITRAKKKRGFLTTINNEIQIYERNDTRLRGFSSVISVSISYLKCIYNREDEGCRHNYDAINDVGYQARYLLLCGAGYGNYNIWEVTFSAVPSCTCISNHDGHHEITFSYTENWAVVHQGSVNAPSLSIGSIFSRASSIPTWATGSSIPTSRIMNELKFEYLTQGLNKDARIHQIFSINLDELVEHNPSIHGRILGPLESSYDDSLSSFHEEKNAEEHNFENKIQSLRGVSNIHATSGDGLTIFTGLDELIIYRMTRLDDLSIEIYERITFAVNEFPSRDLIQAASRRRSVRHFRQIEDVECTFDGQYALIRCSDGAVLLYCLFDIFGCAIEPQSAEVKSQTPLSPSTNPHPPGYLTLCYQIPEQFSLRMSLSYVQNHSSQIDELAMTRWRTKYPSLTDPTTVLVLTGWVPILGSGGIGYPSSKAGVLKADRLCSTVDGLKFFPAFIPTKIAELGVGLFQESPLSRNQRSCWLCGCVGVSHWLESAHKKECETDNFEIQSNKRVPKRRNEPKTITESDNLISPRNNGKRRKKSIFDDDIEILETNQPQDDEVEFLSKSAPEATSVERKPKSTQKEIISKQSNQHEIESLQGEILTLQALVSEKDRECTTLMRKFDKRFEIEMKARRNWNAQMRELQEKLEVEQKKRVEMESRAIEAERITLILKDKLRPLVESFQKEFSGENGENSDSRRTSSRLGSELSPTAAPPPPSFSFCVVCQAYTADTIVLNCGHVCLCNSHATSMQSQGYLKICPVCKQKCSGISRVHR